MRSSQCWLRYLLMSAAAGFAMVLVTLPSGRHCSTEEVLGVLSLARSRGGAFAAVLSRCIMPAILKFIGRDVSRKRIDVGDWHCAFIDPSGRSRVVGNVLRSRCRWPVDMPEDAIAVATGRDHTCMMRPNLDLVCFGANGHGQCDA